MNNNCHYRIRKMKKKKKKKKKKKIRRGEIPFRRGYFDDGISLTEKRLILFGMSNVFLLLCKFQQMYVSHPGNRHTLHAAIIAICENGKANIVFGGRLKCAGAPIKMASRTLRPERGWVRSMLMLTRRVPSRVCASSPFKAF